MSSPQRRTQIIQAKYTRNSKNARLAPESNYVISVISVNSAL